MMGKKKMFKVKMRRLWFILIGDMFVIVDSVIVNGFELFDIVNYIII